MELNRNFACHFFTSLLAQREKKRNFSVVCYTFGSSQNCAHLLVIFLFVCITWLTRKWQNVQSTWTNVRLFGNFGVINARKNGTQSMKCHNFHRIHSDGCVLAKLIKRLRQIKMVKIEFGEKHCFVCAAFRCCFSADYRCETARAHELTHDRKRNLLWQ